MAFIYVKRAKTKNNVISYTGFPGYGMTDASNFNHFSATGRCSGPAHYDVSIRQAGRAASVTSCFKIFLTHTFPRCGATCYIWPLRAMTQLFNGVNFVYRPVEVYLTFCGYYTGDLPRYVLDRFFLNNLTDKSYGNVDDRNNVDLLRIITRASNSKFQLKIGV